MESRNRARPNRKRFYCHKCSRYITPQSSSQDLQCSFCGFGFVEEIENPETTSAVFDGPSTLEMLDQAVMEISNDSDDDDQVEHFVIGHPLNRHGPRTTNGPIETILDQLLRDVLGGRLFGNAGTYTLHGDPGDYAWGPGGIDSVVTQLLNQLESSGAPPATEDEMKSLVDVKISTEEISHSLQCSVCWEIFKLEEKAKALPCKHRYHEECIMPWLKLHGTCPICRKDMNLTDTSTQEPEIPLSSANSYLSLPGGSNRSRGNDGTMADEAPE